MKKLNRIKEINEEIHDLSNAQYDEQKGYENLSEALNKIHKLTIEIRKELREMK